MLKVVDGMVVDTALPTAGGVVLSTFPLGLLIVGLSILLSTAEGFDGRHEMSPRQVALLRAVVTLIAVAAVVQSLSFGFPSVGGNPPDLMRSVLTGLYLLAIGTAAIASVLSLALAWRAAEQPDARALALCMAFLRSTGDRCSTPYSLDMSRGQSQSHSPSMFPLRRRDWEGSPWRPSCYRWRPLFDFLPCSHVC